MEGLKGAHSDRIQLGTNMSMLPLHDQNPHTQQNPGDAESQAVKLLRQDHGMEWDEIAKLLNQERVERGEIANLNAAAVYSRFVRSVPNIATPSCEMGFDAKDYIHLRNPNQISNSTVTNATSKAGKKRIKNYDNAKELETNMRKEVELDQAHEELKAAEKTKQLAEAVAKVERNFWVLVADEMERMTTKMYPPTALSSRYHAL